jgi:ketosteroid isomerase-like protein
MAVRQFNGTSEADHARGRRSGMEISQRLFDLFELRDGKILRMKQYLDPHQALEAVGLSE